MYCRAGHVCGLQREIVNIDACYWLTEIDFEPYSFCIGRVGIKPMIEVTMAQLNLEIQYNGYRVRTAFPSASNAVTVILFTPGVK
jgi:hypothetical protein